MAARSRLRRRLGLSGFALGSGQSQPARVTGLNVMTLLALPSSPVGQSSIPQSLRYKIAACPPLGDRSSSRTKRQSRPPLAALAKTGLILISERPRPGVSTALNRIRRAGSHYRAPLVLMETSEIRRKPFLSAR
jgi:hypothetical protein